jgi:tRNA(Ile)-lysidine synthase
VTDLLDRVRATGLLTAGSPVVVMLSGGRDSVCLLDVAARLSGRDVVVALHVNHGLRGDESDGDEAHCRALAGRLGVELVVERSGPAPRPGNLQAWARDARLSAAAHLAGPRHARVATGHTSTDQAETILYRLAASPGRRALLGMAPWETTWGPASGGHHDLRDPSVIGPPSAPRGILVRPLLRVTREETAAHCRTCGLQWREDSSNASDSYARTRVREGLVPALRALHPAAERNVVRTAELLREEAEVLDELVDTVLAGGDRVGTAHLAALPPALARLVVRRMAEDATGRLCPRASGRLQELIELEDGALDVGEGVRAVVDGGQLHMERTPPLAGT